MKANLMIACCCALAYTETFSQQSIRIPIGQPASLTIAPDARSAAMGEAGVALSADANATYWNPAKLAVADREIGVSASYTPWLATLTDGSWLGYASAYKKLGEKQAIGLAVQNFNYETAYASGPIIDATDLVLSGMYSRQLGQNFSMGLTLKYISSNTGNTIINGAPVHPGRTVAGDISAFYHKRIKSENSGEDFSWSLGAVLSNLGDKVNYGGAGEYFLPTTIKLGGGISYTATGKHRLNVIADLSKLMVPTPDNLQNPNAKPVLKGVIQSFSDAPGGFREEMQEVTLSMGAEYWYNDLIAIRGGYHGENRNKSNQRYLTAGAGVRLFKNYTADASYLFPVDADNPFKNTFRVSLGAYFGSKKG
ncbi:type IX secretion system outer membrane channel protein PorV [Dyadobacter pollutisoli]|uniref:Type IX secretion system outer membrane channel protein PorV n=1 Tax=Dyadobacter pollutisoli TaxID=2910158 RepID=A0A9E8NAX5_9BACT|nr:type IX secretion system outer membrane channel protein PorV [Dyadobacter pollutisoli]WAC12593.1 type IX secretion system outer membrane channel protein PorV [Dyadobacter pollutisoli]